MKSKYFLIFGNYGIRFWWPPRYWHWHIYRGEGSSIYDLGPVTIYI